MKFTKYFLALAAGISMVSATSCSPDDKFLEENLYEWNDETYFNNEASITKVLNATYAHVEYLMVGQSHGQHSWMMQGMGLDTFYWKGTTNEWAVNWPDVKTNNGTTRHWADNLYQVSNRANTVIDMIDQQEGIKYATPTRKQELRAEAVLLRAWAYRALAGMYGNMPIIKHRITDAKYDYQPNTRQEIWEFVYEDLKWAEQNLPTTPRLTGTVTKAAAGAYLAEVCLALGKFKEAEEAATRVIEKKDGDYQIMRTRFGSRANEATDRYGNSLAAPAGAYWDLFREGGNQDLESGNKEAIWTLQYSYGNFTIGGGGDSWSKVRSQTTEAMWTTPLLVGAQDKATNAKTQAQIYKYGDNIACWAAGKTGATASAIATGRYEAKEAQDSLGARVANLGQNLVPTKYSWRNDGTPGCTLWDDENDFRGSETMIQRNWFTPGGTRFLDEKKALYARQAEGIYTFTAGDTVAIFVPRLWKFSDDKHPNGDNKAYDQELYMIRMPEVYLLRAEAYLAQNLKDKAANDINAVRSRANASNVAAADVDIDYILDERTRELLGEEHRQITLNRLSCNPNCGEYVTSKYPVQNATESNTLYARVRKYGHGYENATFKKDTRTDGYESTYSNITPHNYQFPIPDQIIEANTGFPYPQNPGY